MSNRLHSLAEMAQLGVEQAQRWLIGTKEQLSPSWLLQNQDGERALVMTPWASDIEKSAILAAMRKTMRVQQTVSYSLVVEAWAASYPNGTDWQNYVRPSKREDRMEMVMVLATDGTEVVLRDFKIIRDWHTGKCKELEELPASNSKDYSSPFLTMLSLPEGTNS